MNDLSTPSAPSEGPLFFLHLPKTAGTTLNAIVERRFARDSVCPAYFTSDLPSLPARALRSYRYFRGHLHYDAVARALGSRPVTMTVLRDPVDQYASSYAHFRRFSDEDWARIDEHDGELVKLVRQTPLEEIVRHPRAYRIAEAQQTALLRPMDESGRVAPAGDGEAVAAARARLASFEFVGLTERFEESLLLLCYTFGWFPPEGWSTLNADPRGKRAAGLDSATAARIREINAADLLLYDDARAMFERRYRDMELALLREFGEEKDGQHAERLLTPDRIRSLVARRYERLFRERSRPLSRLTFTFDQPVSPDENWYEAELSPGRAPARWTGPGCVSRLDLPLAGGVDLSLRLHILHAVSHEVLKSFRLRVNGCAVPLSVTTERPPGQWLSGRVTREVLAEDDGLARLELEVGETVAPCELDPSNRDGRKLGVLIDRLEVVPLADASAAGDEVCPETARASSLTG